MKCNIILFALVVLVLEVSCLDNEKAKKEYEADRWIWGYVDVAQNKTDATKPPVTERLTMEEKENPCQKTTPPMPNYRAQGKRIAEQKCEEYIWEVNDRIERNKISRACHKYLQEQGMFGVAAIGGRNALPSEFPHMAAIGWKSPEGTNVFKCGGILISPKFVLTAAHCTKADDRDTEIAEAVPKVVRFGDKSIKDGDNDYPPITRNISRVIVHPDYKSPTKYNDIALIELEEELLLDNNVQPACLWHQFDTTPLGKKATATGWGVVQASSRNTSTILQVVDIDIIDSKSCDELLRPNCNRLWCGIKDTQICAGKLSGGVDACQGDSGGPLQVKIPLQSYEEGSMHYVIGITSFGFGCALQNTPGVYTRVSPFLDWIESYVW